MGFTVVELGGSSVELVDIVDDISARIIELGVVVDETPTWARISSWLSDLGMTMTPAGDRNTCTFT
jgi:hypothetical protein